jgi:hypothetical protein
MSMMIFYCTKLHLPKCNGAWVASIRQKINVNYEPPITFVCLVFTKNGLSKKCFVLWKTYKRTKLHDPTLSGGSFASTSQVRMLAILEWLKLLDFFID